MAAHHSRVSRRVATGPVASSAFLALLWPRLSDRRNQLVAVAAAAVALGVVPIAPAGVPVLAAAGVALLAGLLTRGVDPTEFPEAHR